jgi:hypothetical protein
MPERIRRWLTWLALAAIVLAELLSQVLAVVTGADAGPLTIAMLAFPVIGALVASRHPRNAVGWIMVGVGAGIALEAVLATYAHYALAVDPGSLPGGAVALALHQPMWVLVSGLPGTFLIMLFPDGQLPSRRWRPWAYFCALAIVVIYAMILIGPGSFEDTGYPGVRNPFGIAALAPVAEAVIAVVMLLPVAIAGCAVGLVQRYRRSSGQVRVQLKWLAAAGAVVALTYIALMTLNLPFVTTEQPTPRWVEVVSGVGIFTFVLIPVAVGIAILRHGLYDIDIIINRTLVYGVLTATLTGTYLVVVTILQDVLRPLTGESQFAVAASTLVIAAAFRPARVRIQALVDRRFYRSKVDARATLASFSSRLTQEVDLEALAADLVGVVNQAMKPVTASLWLRKTGPR